MIRVLTAHTFEIDDPQAAVGEILEQLDLEQTLRKNSVGLVFCPQDFITSGTMEAVCNALPFDVIGGTSQAVSVPGAMGEFMLAVMVLTGDTFLSAAGSSRPFDGDEESRIRELYGRLSSSLAVPPSMMFLIHPQLTGFAGNQVVDTLDQVSGGRPLFGTVAVGETLKDQSPMIIHNGAAYSDRISLLLISGVENRFCVESIPAMDIRNQPVLVTGASGNRLISINHIPAAEFMEKIGIICNGALNAVSAFPLLIDNHDGMGLKFCAIHSIENDVLRCSNTITTGATLKIGSLDRKEILQSTVRLTETLNQESGRNGYLVFSCYGRNIVLVDLKDEMEVFQKQMGEAPPYIFVLSGGEFCPVYQGDGSIHNRFHQYSIISASF